MNDKKKVTFQLPVEVYEALVRLAASERRSMNAQAVVILENASRQESL